MFKTSQIIPASKLTRYFPRVCKDLNIPPHAVLITRRNGEHVVLVSAEIYEDLLEAKFREMHRLQEKRGSSSGIIPA